ncbi:hypothetical protein J6590_008247 [Homalodisca vitripennis]|nr:hypothetical protein J6590_008247 [Homalodisca vitripennis]
MTPGSRNKLICPHVINYITSTYSEATGCGISTLSVIYLLEIHVVFWGCTEDHPISQY